MIWERAGITALAHFLHQNHPLYFVTTLTKPRFTAAGKGEQALARINTERFSIHKEAFLRHALEGGNMCPTNGRGERPCPKAMPQGHSNADSITLPIWPMRTTANTVLGIFVCLSIEHRQARVMPNIDRGLAEWRLLQLIRGFWTSNRGSIRMPSCSNMKRRSTQEVPRMGCPKAINYGAWQCSLKGRKARQLL